MDFLIGMSVSWDLIWIELVQTMIIMLYFNQISEVHQKLQCMQGARVGVNHAVSHKSPQNHQMNFFSKKCHFEVMLDQ